MRWTLAFASLALVLSSAYASASQVQLAEAIHASLSWEKRWYGIVAGQQCIRREGTESVGWAIASGAQQPSLVDCKSGAQQPTNDEGFDAYLEGPQIFLVGRLNSPSRAEVVDGESWASCRVREDDLKERATLIRRKGIKLNIKADAYENLGPETTPSQALQLFVARSVRSWLSLKGEPLPKAVYVGTVAPGDPFLVVAVPPKNLHLIPMPSTADVSGNKGCGLVFSIDRFLGRDAPRPAELRKHVLERLQNHSVTVLLD